MALMSLRQIDPDRKNHGTRRGQPELMRQVMEKMCLKTNPLAWRNEVHFFLAFLELHVGATFGQFVRCLRASPVGGVARMLVARSIQYRRWLKFSLQRTKGGKESARQSLCNCARKVGCYVRLENKCARLYRPSVFNMLGILQAG